jgi:hypothetical protein
LLFRKYLMFVCFALLASMVTAGSAFAAVLDSKEAETMTLQNGATINGAGQSINLNANGEQALWTDGGAAGGNTVVASVRTDLVTSTTVCIELLKNGVEQGTDKCVNPGENTFQDKSWTSLTLADSDDLTFRASSIGASEIIFMDLARVEGTAPDTTPPTTTLTSSDLTNTNDNTPTFTFTGSDNIDPSPTFECRVDAGSYSACTSPHTTATLADGSHTFDVRAKDASSNVDATPASDTFTVDTVAPALPTVTSGPGGGSVDPDGDFEFAWTGEAGGTFECSLDNGTINFSACTSPKEYLDQPSGSYWFRVRQIDAAGNVGSTRTRNFSVSSGDTTAPNTTFGTLTQSDVAGRDISATFSGTDDVTPAGSLTFQCSLDTGTASWSSCTSPKTYADQASGSYTFRVRATDAASNTDATPATQAVLVKSIINVTNSPYNATGNDTTNDTTAIENAMGAAGADTVVYIPNGTFYGAAVNVPGNTELVMQDGVTIKRHGSNGDIFILQGVEDTSFAENIDIYSVGGRALIDVSTGWTNSTPFLLRSVKNFSVKHFDIAANNTNEDTGSPNTEKTAFTLLPFDNTLLSGEYEHPHNGVIEDIHETGGGFGWGAAQLTGAEDVHFEDVSTVGGTTLRLENFQSNHTTIDDVTADGLTCTDGSAIVLFNPHNANNGDVTLNNLTSNSCYAAIRVQDDDSYPSGNFDASTIDNVDAFDGTTAQVPNTSGSVIDDWLYPEDAVWCIEKEASLNYPMPTITNVSCDGLPSNNWP